MHGKHPIHPFLACKSPLVSHQHANEFKHDLHSGKGWTWTHQHISHETSADGSSSSACVPICGVVGADHESVWASGMTSWVIPSCYQTSLDCMGRKTMSSSPDQLDPDSRRWEKPVSPHVSNNGMTFPLCSHSQLMPMWPLDSSSGLSNTTEDFGDATLWHSYVPRYRPLRQSTASQPNNEVNNSKCNIGWHDCHFVLIL